jgi:predicted DNA-binding transcriptional regulator
MVKGSYVLDIERALKEGKLPSDLLGMILTFLDFNPNEIKMYNLLLRRPLNIKEIEEELRISERTIRKYIDRLDKNGLITKRVEQGKRLKYIYISVPPLDVWNRLEKRIQQMLSEVTKVLKSKAFL